ncbi:O-methyltransferase [Foetidibacter luteolus]|uniref:O-methyltransferase n=1 Tax=Foetidibacter luteolus TaxID=2608880 RepID=UPI00129A7E38|nr:O-methyltransferase [Foetidibacter luteolus]
MNQQTFEAVDKYIADLFLPPDDSLDAAEQSLEKAGMPAISVSPNQGKFLHLLALTCNANKILELGTLAGYSTIWMARALKEGGKLISLEVDEKHAAVARENLQRAGVGNKAEVRVGKAIEILPQLVQNNEGPFDMIFIDADKPPYTEYFEWALKLSRPGTLIIADNVIRDGKVLNEDSDDEMVKGVQRFNKALAASTAVTASIIQTVGVKEYDGMALAIVK